MHPWSEWVPLAEGFVQTKGRISRPASLQGVAQSDGSIWIPCPTAGPLTWMGSRPSDFVSARAEIHRFSLLSANAPIQKCHTKPIYCGKR